MRCCQDPLHPESKVTISKEKQHKSGSVILKNEKKKKKKKKEEKKTLPRSGHSPDFSSMNAQLHVLFMNKEENVFTHEIHDLKDKPQNTVYLN